MVKTHIRGYKRCKWMAIVAAVFAVMTIGFIIPGAIGLAGANHYNDTLLYLALIDLLFATLFFIGWWSCQIEVDDPPPFEHHTAIRKTRSASSSSLHSISSITSATTHQLLTLGGAGKFSTVKEA